MSQAGSITAALLHLRAYLEGVLAPFSWTVSAAESPFQRLEALSAVGAGGKCVVSWAGDGKVDQAGRSLVIKARITVALAAKKDVVKPEIGKLLGTGPRLFEIHDRVKGAMLGLSMPAEIVPEPGADVPIYAGSAPVVAPNGEPLDAIEQTWEIELLESFEPN